MSSKPQEPEISPILQQKIGKLQVRLGDLMDEINIVLKAFIEENQQQKTKITELQLQIEAPNLKTKKS